MSFLAFLVAAVVLAITPGPGIAYVIARTVAGGRVEGLASCFGTAAGGMIHLVSLGVRLLVQKTRDVEAVRVAAQGPRRALLEGVVVEILNVKTALFFLAFLPQFVRASEPVVPQLVLLGTTCVALNTLVDVVAVLSSVRLLASRAARAARARLLRRTSGATMVALGAYLALSKREA
jgi:threonine/homoserine/homoserine lactone efflux protein